ncbi:MAG: sigma-70 family RNA polymerase sigma factor [Saprospiraceae bacterium]|jgi:RNA polymerase sigma-70 factor (ECF subfamily)
MSTTQRDRSREFEIIALLQQGDQQAISMLYKHYAAALFGIIRRIIAEQEIAEEVLQDVFVKVWDNAARYDSAKGRLYTWLAQITRNTALDRVRSSAYRKGQKTDGLDSVVYKNDQNTENMQVQDSGLLKVISDLDADYRTLIDYAYFQGFSQSEIAKELDMPLGTVKTRMRAAVIELRKRLNNETFLLLLLLSLCGSLNI